MRAEKSHGEKERRSKLNLIADLGSIPRPGINANLSVFWGFAFLSPVKGMKKTATIWMVYLAIAIISMSTVLCLTVIAVFTKCPTIYVVALIGSITMATLKVVKAIFSLGLSAISRLRYRVTSIARLVRTKFLYQPIFDNDSNQP